MVSDPQQATAGSFDSQAAVTTQTSRQHAALMSLSVQRWCVILGGLGVVLGTLVGLFVFAHWLPVPSPSLSARQTADLYRNNTTSIRIGMLLVVVAGACVVVYAAAATCQFRRAEGGAGPLTLIYFGSCCIGSLQFIYPAYFFETAAFRADRPDETIQAISDLAFLPFIGSVPTLVAFSAAQAIVMLIDRGPVPVFPRCLGYFNLWATVLFTPGLFIVFFHRGLLAWNGLLGWYIPLAALGIWAVINAVFLLRAIDNQKKGLSPPPSHPRHALPDQPGFDERHGLIPQ